MRASGAIVGRARALSAVKHPRLIRSSPEIIDGAWHRAHISSTDVKITSGRYAAIVGTANLSIVLRAATSALVAALAATVTFGVVSAGSASDSIDEAAVARRTAARAAAPAATAPPVTAPPETAPPAAPTPVSDEGTVVVDLLNAERAGRGLAPVQIHGQVLEAALAHSTDQATKQFMSHTGSDGSNTGDRLLRAGFDWRGWAENVGAGQPTPQDIFDGWMNSAGHRQNMLGDYDYIGVAVVTGGNGVNYWTMVLANS